MKCALEVEECRAYWAHTDGTTAISARQVFDNYWFGARSLERVEVLLVNMRARFDTFPAALQTLHRWPQMAPDTRKLICHWHLQLADPLYRAFTGAYLVSRRAAPRTELTRDLVVSFVTTSGEPHWSMAARVQFASKLLSAAYAAGLVETNRDPRPLVVPRVGDDALEYLLYLLRERRYNIDTFFSVLVLPLDRPLNRKLNGDVVVRRIDESEAETWLRAVGGGFDGDSSLATEMRTILAPNFYSESSAIFLAEIDGQAVGGGAMYVHDGVVEFGSTSTLPNYRRQGVQTALLDARLKLAQEMGCDLAMVITSPGTASQRNVMRLGFEMAYTKVAMRGEGR
jgi:GNAT superfamily N-acetyltransferase